MRFYSYNEISIIRDDLYNLVNQMEKSVTAKYEAKELAKKMKPYISEYDTLLSSMKINDVITDGKLIQGFEETRQFLNILKEQQF